MKNILITFIKTLILIICIKIINNIFKNIYLNYIKIIFKYIKNINSYNYLYYKKIFYKISNILYLSIYYIGISTILESFNCKTIILIYKIIDVFILIKLLVNIICIIDYIILIIQFKKDYYTKINIILILQIKKIIFIIFTFLIIISIIIGCELTTTITCASALTALLILIFKDIILSFISSIQISITKTININDYIIIPKYKIKGKIYKFNLINTIIIDKNNYEIIIPTYYLINTHIINNTKIKNKKIKLYNLYMIINPNSICLLDEISLNKLKKDNIYKKYIYNKVKNNKHIFTNLHLYIKYIFFYFKKKYPYLNINNINNKIILKNKKIKILLIIKYSSSIIKTKNILFINIQILYHLSYIADNFKIKMYYNI